MDRIYLLAPALILAAAFVFAFVVYCALCAVGRPPNMVGVKHNDLFGPFMAGFLVWLLGPLERLLIGRVSPNVITAVSLAMCAATGVAAGYGSLAVAVWLYVFAGILDVLDGRLARLGGKQSAAGALFDSVSDRWGELFVFSGYLWYLHDSPWMLAVFAAVGASMMVSYTRARAEALGVEVSGGMMQRAERIVLVTGGTLIAAWLGGASIAPILGTTMLICAATATATAINRWLVAFRELGKRETRPIVVEQPVAVAIPPRLASLSSPELRKVLPLEQH